MAPKTEVDYSSLSAAQLKQNLKELGVVASGSKESLVQRLQLLGSVKRKAGDEPTPGATKATAMKAVVTKAVSTKQPPANSKQALKAVKVTATIAKVKKGKKSKGASDDDLGDLLSPAAPLQKCLRSVPPLPILKTIIGPGPCLLKALPAKTSVETLKSMVEANEFECKAQSVAGLSLQHRLVIRLYTAEEPVPLYRVLNAPFNEQARSIAKIANQAPFMKLLIQAVRALTAAGKPYVYTGPAYRGVRVASNPTLKRQYENYAEKFQVGSRVTFAAFTSLSLSDSTAESFGDQILFQFTRVRGVRIAALSAIPSEREILVEPPAVFEIKSCAKFHGVLSVVLEAVDSPLRYL